MDVITFGECVTLGKFRYKHGFIVDLKVIGLVFQTRGAYWFLFKNPMENGGQMRKKTAHTYTRLAQCHSIPPGQIFKLIINISGELKINCLQCYEFGFGESPYVLRWLLPHRHIFYTQ